MIDAAQLEEQAAEQEKERKQKSFMGCIGRVCAFCCEEDLKVKKRREVDNTDDGVELGRGGDDRGRENSGSSDVHSSTEEKNEEEEEEDEEGCLLRRV